MGSYYALLEARRTARADALSFLCWLEDTSNLLIIAPNAPAGAESKSKMSITEALDAFS